MDIEEDMEEQWIESRIIMRDLLYFSIDLCLGKNNSHVYLVLCKVINIYYIIHIKNEIGKQSLQKEN